MVFVEGWVLILVFLNIKEIFMKKFNLLIAILLMCFSGLLSAATINMSAIQEDGLGSTVHNDGTEDVQGVMTVSGEFDVKWLINVNPDTNVLAVSVENPNSAFRVDEVSLIGGSVSKILTNNGGGNEWIISALLVNGVDYTLRIVGELLVSGEKTLTSNVSAVPVPAAVWLFGSALMGLVGISRRKSDMSLSA